MTGNLHPWAQSHSTRLCEDDTAPGGSILAQLPYWRGVVSQPLQPIRHQKMTNKTAFVKARWKPDYCSLRGLFIKTTDATDHGLDLGGSQERTDPPSLESRGPAGGPAGCTEKHPSGQMEWTTLPSILPKTYQRPGSASSEQMVREVEKRTREEHVARLDWEDNPRGKPEVKRDHGAESPSMLTHLLSSLQVPMTSILPLPGIQIEMRVKILLKRI